MINPLDINIKDFWYDLPASRIAEFPLENRDQSKLLVYKRGNVPGEFQFKDLPAQLPEKSMLILNDTRVIHARLLFQKSSGARIEVFCLNPLLPTRELQAAFALPSPVTWECLIGNARRWKEGVLTMETDSPSGKILLRAEKTESNEIIGLQPQDSSNHFITFSWSPPEKSFSSIIESLGTVPLPPYIHRESRESDKVRYQTVYARQQGSVAAPTAGLHFTDTTFNDLKNRGMDALKLTLHVGAGTFKPVTSEKVGDHSMHAEPFEISLYLLEFLLENVSRPMIAVGTTSVRTLESVYLAGLRLLQGAASLNDLLIRQWEPYTTVHDSVYSKTEILTVLIEYLNKSKTTQLKGNTRLLIAPGYRFGFVDGIVTNFHQPNSTLLLLIAAFLGEEWKNIYQFALKNDYRFLSYGDSCLFM